VRRADERAQGHKAQAKTGSPGSRQKTRKEKEPTPEDLHKLRIADELGLGDKVRRVGWGGLSAAETGKIGGYMTRKARAEAKGEV